MDAGIYLTEITEQFSKLSLEAVLIGNAAAAIQGAPVITIDIDFLFRKTPANVAKLKKFAKALDLVIFNPLYPASQMFRLMRESDTLQATASAHANHCLAGPRGSRLEVRTSWSPAWPTSSKANAPPAAPKISRPW